MLGYLSARRQVITLSLLCFGLFHIRCINIDLCFGYLMVPPITASDALSPRDAALSTICHLATL